MLILERPISPIPGVSSCFTVIVIEESVKAAAKRRVAKQRIQNNIFAKGDSGQLVVAECIGSYCSVWGDGYAC